MQLGGPESRKMHGRIGVAPHRGGCSAAAGDRVVLGGQYVNGIRLLWTPRCAGSDCPGDLGGHRQYAGAAESDSYGSEEFLTAAFRERYS